TGKPYPLPADAVKTLREALHTFQVPVAAADMPQSSTSPQGNATLAGGQSGPTNETAPSPTPASQVPPDTAATDAYFASLNREERREASRAGWQRALTGGWWRVMLRCLDSRRIPPCA